MTTYIRLLITMARPAVVVLLGLFAATGAARSGNLENPVLLGQVLLVVVGFLLYSVLINDLADEAIDRVNLPGDSRRPLVTGSSTRHDFVVMAITAAVIAVGASALLGWRATAVLVAGLALSTAYSIRPVRLADRGTVASLVLPAGYVAVPYLVGIFSGRSLLNRGDVVLLAGLYIGFIGRILLKDFRDVRGDALFGKRTFLVRYGRRATCRFSAVCWIAGSTTVLAAGSLSAAFVSLHLVELALALVLLRALSVDRGVRRDEALISAIALVGRGMVVTLIAHLAMTNAGWTAYPSTAVLAGLGVVVIGQSRDMARRGPITKTSVATLGFEDHELVQTRQLDHAPSR